jgi:PAS domain S-box-containing protein
MTATTLLHNLLEALPDAIVAINREGTILHANSQTVAMFGYTRDELIDQPVEILLQPQHR